MAQRPDHPARAVWLPKWPKLKPAIIADKVLHVWFWSWIQRIRVSSLMLFFTLSS